jgi:hypothetical protein
MKQLVGYKEGCKDILGAATDRNVAVTPIYRNGYQLVFMATVLSAEGCMSGVTFEVPGNDQEENEDFRDTVSEELERLGARVFTADNAPEFTIICRRLWGDKGPNENDVADTFDKYRKLIEMAVDNYLKDPKSKRHYPRIVVSNPPGALQ